MSESNLNNASQLIYPSVSTSPLRGQKRNSFLQWTAEKPLLGMTFVSVQKKITLHQKPCGTGASSSISNWQDQLWWREWFSSEPDLDFASVKLSCVWVFIGRAYGCQLHALFFTYRSPTYFVVNNLSKWAKSEYRLTGLGGKRRTFTCWKEKSTGWRRESVATYSWSALLFWHSTASCLQINNL